jgi:hypothetical protein
MVRVSFHSTEIGEARKPRAGFEAMSPGHAIFLNGVTQNTNPENGVPGGAKGLTTTMQTSMLTIVSPLAH